MTTRPIVAIAAIGVTASLATQAAPALAQNAPGATINVPVPQPPPADQPLIRKIPKPSFSVEGGAGVLGYIGGTGRVGPAWNVRVTADLTPHIALEGNYLGAANARSDHTGTLTYTTLDAGARYNILRADQAPLQPFVTAGLGWGAWIGPGGTPGSLVIPVSVGAERLLTEHISIGARFSLRPAFFADLGHGYERDVPGGSTWVVLANVGGGF